MIMNGIFMDVKERAHCVCNFPFRNLLRRWKAAKNRPSLSPGWILIRRHMFADIKLILRVVLHVCET